MIGKVILGIGTAILTGVLIWSIGAPDRKAWNGGLCVECGGAMKYSHTIPHSSYLQFVYECTDCGSSIWTETNFR